MGMKNLSQRNRIILYIITLLLILSMIISALVSFTPRTTSTNGESPTATVAAQ
jgi:hypothetical protein